MSHVYKSHPDSSQLALRVKPEGGKPVDPAPRECGPCRACCVAPSIDCRELFKRKWQPCPLLNKEGPPCSIYHRRPDVCRSFVCAWLAGDLPEELRPDRCGMFVTIRPTKQPEPFKHDTYRDVLVLSLTETGPNEWTEESPILSAAFDWIREKRRGGDERLVVFEINMHPKSRRGWIVKDYICRFNAEAQR